MNPEDYYQYILKLKDELGRRSYKDCLALAENNDPYYAGRGNRKMWAEWFVKMVKDYKIQLPAYARKIHYRILHERIPLPTEVKGDKIYSNTLDCYMRLSYASRDARYLGLIPYDAIVDEVRPKLYDEGAYTESGVDIYYSKPGVNDPEELELTVGSGFVLDQIEELPEIEIWNEQSDKLYHVEIWVEKNTLNDVLIPYCEKHDITLVTFGGNPSLYYAWRLYNKVDIPARLFMLTDFDPAGVDMRASASRHLQYICETEGQKDIKLYDLALTAEQIDRLDLPSDYIKKKPKQLERWIRATGKAEYVEIDALAALHPDEIERLLDEQALPYAQASIQGWIDDEIESNEFSFNTSTESSLEMLEKERDELREKVREEIKPFYSEIEAIISKHAGELSELNSSYRQAWREIAEDFEQFDISTSNGKREESIEDELIPDDPALFDSGREYIEQTDILIDFKDGKRGYAKN